MRTTRLLGRIQQKTGRSFRLNNTSKRGIYEIWRPRAHLKRFLAQEPLFYHQPFETKICSELFESLQNDLDHSPQCSDNFPSGSANISDNKDHYGIHLDLPGVKKEDISIKITGMFVKVFSAIFRVL